MSSPLQVGAPHHIRLTVTDVVRSRAFYEDVFGFQVALPGPPDDDPDGLVADALQGGVVLMNAGVMIGLRPVDATNADDRFDPFRVGLDHLSFGVASRDDLDAAMRVFDERGIDHGPIREVPAMGLAFLAVFDPDGIAVELTAQI
ncbi:VOC family protein [Petropleomorpha daqingensis]|uniref:Catechol 2,3-dioxygenase-like lactoylglutathione lyase family enzyme n=1 Tax=Petropleomorpha daqingensis TaxID=2026353 RepID=A0A853CB40_9ACTN|nr:VOC family protein [Petropleomorpha daqingensis]NYJ04557.1 catechol 2,3-dioxygenase-like lactoylglutathione lyase family enzyme [Petropleomorpha daqingensis]